MGVSCHSNSSRAGALQNQKHFPKPKTQVMRNFKTTKRRLQQFDSLDKTDLQLQQQLDKVKFYPKTNQADARHQANKVRMGRSRGSELEQHYFTGKIARSPLTLSDQNKMSSQTKKNYELEVAPPSEKSENSLNPLQSPIGLVENQNNLSPESQSLLKIDDQNRSILQTKQRNGESRFLTSNDYGGNEL